MNLGAQAKKDIYDHVVLHRIYISMMAMLNMNVCENIPDEGIDIETLAKKVSAHPDFLSRTLKFLGCYDIFQYKSGRFFNTGKSRQLDKRDPLAYTNYLSLHYTDFFMKAWASLEQSIKTGLPAFDIAHNKPFFDYVRDNKEAAKIFDAAMASSPVPRIRNLVDNYNFSKFESIMDVGGGFGHLLAGILRENPKTTGILFDMPHVIERSQKQEHFQTLDGRILFENGDFFSKINSKADCILMVHVIHDWGKDDSVRILKTCREALKIGGEIILAERLLPETPSVEAAPLFFMDMQMLTCTSLGRERTRAEFEELGELSGLQIRDVHFGGPVDSIIVYQAG